MAFTKITNSEMNTHGVRGLPDTPNLSAYDIQCKFDELATDVLRPAHDRLIDELEDTTGAASIGAEVPVGMIAQNNVQSILNNIGTVSHTHTNKDVLDKLSTDSDDRLLFDGNTIASKSYSTIDVDGTEINADIDDTLKLIAGDNVTLVPNVTNKSVTFNMAHNEENVFVKFSAYPDGTNFVDVATINTPYMGIAVVFDNVAPTDKSAYKWILTGIETQPIPQMSINWNTGELEYTGQTYTFFVDTNGYLHWGVV